MIYPYMEFPDGTEIVHTGIIHQNDGDHVEVHFERPKDGGFDTARCSLPEYKWIIRNGFTDSEIAEFTQMLEKSAHLFFKFAQNGGISCA